MYGEKREGIKKEHKVSAEQKKTTKKGTVG